MKYAVTWTPEALSTFGERIEYLKYIGQKKKTNFKKRVNEYLEIFKVSLIYRVNITTKEIQLISFIDNRENPGYIRKHRV